jgi:plastocyanin
MSEFAFSPNALTGRAGQALSLQVANAGQFPHTFTIDGLAGADTNTVNAGGNMSITFTPAVAGTLTFYCKVHGAALMSGQLTVSAGASGAPGGAPSGGSAGGSTTSSATPAATGGTDPYY